MGKADIHIHTTYSDGLNEPEAVVNYVVTQTDLDVIAITDHNTIDGAQVAYDYWQQHRHDFREMTVIKGVEISSASGHILGLFLEEDVPMNMSAADTVRAIHEQGGLAIAAHPFTHLLPFTDFKGIGRRIASLPLDGVEARSSVPTELYANWLTTLFNRRHANHPALGSSDAHYLTMIGKTYTLFPGKTAVDFRRAVAEGAVRPGGRVNGLVAVAQVVQHLVQRRRVPVFLPNDHHFSHGTAGLRVDADVDFGLGLTTLAMNGRLSRDSAHVLKQEAWRQMASGQNRLVLDVSQVDFVDSAGLGVLVAIQKKIKEASDGQFCLVGPQDAVMQTIKLVRLDRVFAIFETKAEAMRALAHGENLQPWQPIPA